MVHLGIVSQVEGTRVKVAIGNMVTDFLPVFAPHSNSFAQKWTPLRVGEQVCVLPVCNETNSGIVIRGLYYKEFPTPSVNQNLEVTVYEDGTVISYDTNAKELNISAVNNITINCINATINAQNTTLTSSTTTINSTSTHNGDVVLNGNLLLNGSINVAGGSGGNGATINGDINITGNISAGGNVRDSRGDLTNHTNEGRGRD